MKSTEEMSHISEEDRKLAKCERCGKMYPVNVSEKGDVRPIGIGECRDCGGIGFTILESDSGDRLAAGD